MADSVKEVDVFRKYTKNNKLKVVLIALGIFLALVLFFYFFSKFVLVYTIEFETFGGTKVDSRKYVFLEKTEEPKVKKTGFYLEKWSTDENFTDNFKFGSPLWKSVKVYADWQPGFAVILNFAEGEENEDLSLTELKDVYEQYVKPGSEYSIPKVINLEKSSEHYGEQLFWYENPECTGTPFDEKTFTVDKDINLYGKWFDVDESKFKIESGGVLVEYLGNCNKIMLPSSVAKIKDIDPNLFSQGETDQPGDTTSSVFKNVINDLETIYLNQNLAEIGACSFRSLSALKNVYFLGDNIQVIGKYAFKDCTSLEIIEIPEGVQLIEEYAFHGDSSLSQVIFPNSLKTIERFAFGDNYKLKEINLPNVETLKDHAFSMCFKLTKVTLGNTSMVGLSTSDADPFDGVVNNSPGAEILKIYVPYSLLDTYKTNNAWSKYSSYFTSII